MQLAELPQCGKVERPVKLEVEIGNEEWKVPDNG